LETRPGQDGSQKLHNNAGLGTLSKCPYTLVDKKIVIYGRAFGKKVLKLKRIKNGHDKTYNFHKNY
jgi:hypothetical protein